MRALRNYHLNVTKLLYSTPTKSSYLLRQLSTLIDDTNHETNTQNPPEPLPNRPLRGQKPFNRQSKDAQKATKTDSSFDFTKRVSGGFANDASFLEKFKLNAKAEKRDTKENSDKLSEGDRKVSFDEGPTPDADDIFKKMKETGLIPNAVAMLDGLCKDGLVQEAMKLFGLMREKGTIPEVVIYTAVVEGFCKARKVEDAKRIFRKMQGNGIVPNAFSYGVVVQGMCRCGKMDDAVEFCVEMLETGHSPNVATFVGLVDGLCREKGVEEARSIVTRLRQKGFFLNEKAVREFLDKKAPFSPPLWEAIFGKKNTEKLF